jgi:CMP-N,N'-diacetyllegionaminic acid synthase
MKPICYIAARGGSKGVPRKNIRLLNKKPLIAHSIQSAKKTKIFSSIIVSTDDKEIAEIAEKFGAEIPFLRPKKLAGDKIGMTEVLLHDIKKLHKKGYVFDTLVNRDCTVPFIRIDDIKKSIKLYEKTKCDLVCGVYRQHLNPYFNMMELDSNGFLKFSKRINKKIINRQDAPIVYQLNGLFVLNIINFLKTKKFYMKKCVPYEIPPETGIMIDTEIEFQMAETIAKNM